jgi:hypothetical protein
MKLKFWTTLGVLVATVLSTQPSRSATFYHAFIQPFITYDPPVNLGGTLLRGTLEVFGNNPSCNTCVGNAIWIFSVTPGSTYSIEQGQYLIERGTENQFTWTFSPPFQSINAGIYSASGTFLAPVLGVQDGVPPPPTYEILPLQQAMHSFGDYILYDLYTYFDGPTRVGTLEIQIPTPLPAALPLFATGLTALGLLGWHRKRKTAA